MRIWRGGAKEKMKSFRRNLRAISPIFATLILIAIAVIAGVVVYMFTSGTLATMTGGGTAAQEKITVQTASWSSSAGLTAYIEQTSGPAATINSLILKDASGNVVGSPITSVTPAGTLTIGTLTPINGALATLGSGVYTVTVTTKAGGSFVSPSFTV
jgi:flagellin-like protein